MSHFILVHGAWVGPSVWERVAAPLRAAGHTVDTPTLAGLGSRAGEATPETDLGTHVAEITDAVQRSDGDVVLVGHSYGGMVITGVADKAAAALTRLVYVDAFIPSDGQSALDLFPPEMQDGIRAAAKEYGDGWKIPPLPLEVAGVMDPEESAVLGRLMVPQPLQTYEQPLRLDNLAGNGLPASFVLCTAWMAAFAFFAEQARTWGWPVSELTTHHYPMLSQPEQLVGLLNP